MDVRTLEYFVFVAEEGSISGGARRAMVAQPGVSGALRKLERQIGGPLFERSARGVELTRAGGVLLTYARQILGMLDEARDETRICLTQGRTSFTVGMIAGRVSAGELTWPILDAFQRANPEIQLHVRELNFAEQVDAVRDGRVDIALVRSPYEHEDLAMEPLFTEPSVLVADARHPLARITETSVEDVLKQRCLEAVRAPREWREFWNLTELRNEAGRSIPSDSLDLMSYALDLVRNSAVTPMAQSAWRLGGIGQPTLKAIRLVDAPRSIIGIGYRRSDGRREIVSFVRMARRVTQNLCTIVPDAELLMSSGSHN